MATLRFDVKKSYELELSTEEIRAALDEYHRSTLYNSDAVPVRGEDESADDYLTRLVSAPGMDSTLVGLVDSLGLDVADDEVDVWEWDADDEDESDDEE